jgi:phage/plasmid-associated DNA primase
MIDIKKIQDFCKVNGFRSSQELFADCVTGHGPPLYRSKIIKSPQRLNEPFWCEYLAGERILFFEAPEDRFYAYNPDNGLFEMTSPQGLKAHLSDLIEIADSQWPGCREIKKLNTDFSRRSVIELLRGKVEQRDFFAARPLAIHCQNTMVSFENGSIRTVPFSPKFRSRNQSPIPYDPKAAHKEFTRAFFGRMPNYDISLLQKYYGQCLLGRNLSQTLILFDGIADSSKTTLARIIGELVGQNNCTELRTAQLEERFETSAFIGKTLLMAPDVNANFLSRYGATVIKRLVGTDLMSAEFKRANARVSFEGAFNVVITSNSRLRARFQGDNDAWARRILIVRFEHPHEGERIVDFHRVIVEKEGPGILNFSIGGVRNLLCDMKRLGKIEVASQQEARVRKFVDESDSLRIFVRTNLCSTSDKACDVTTNEVLDAYFEHCVDNDLNSLPTKEARRDLEEIMRELFGRSLSNSIQRDGKAKRGFPMIKWRNGDDEDDPKD